MVVYEKDKQSILSRGASFWREHSWNHMVRVRGLEPPRLSAYEPKSHAATNYATPAYWARFKFGRLTNQLNDRKEFNNLAISLYYTRNYIAKTSLLLFITINSNRWRAVQGLNLAPQINSLVHNPLCQQPKYIYDINIYIRWEEFSHFLYLTYILYHIFL